MVLAQVRSDRGSYGKPRLGMTAALKNAGYSPDRLAKWALKYNYCLSIRAEVSLLQSMSVALFSAGLGDIIRTCYLTQSYHVVSHTRVKFPVIVASHNPYSMEIFRYHRNAEHLLLYELGHKYQEFLAAGLRGPAISRALVEFAGYEYSTLIRGEPLTQPPLFDAPDDIKSSGHIIFQPFAGNCQERTLPASVIQQVLQVLRRLPYPVFVITRSYARTAHDGNLLHSTEDASYLEGGNVHVLSDLSVPASLNLIKRCRAYVGSWSSLQQAAWLENKPVAVFYPKNWSDVVQRTDYAFGMERRNTLGVEFTAIEPSALSAFLQGL